MTSKPISTISYNTEGFLLGVLGRLTSSCTVSDWHYIKHIGEDGDKDHIHLWMQPNKSVDLMCIRDMFVEPVVGGRPLGVMPLQHSELYHWWLYGLHDRAYLRTKRGGDGKLPYSLADMRSYEPMMDSRIDVSARCELLACSDLAVYESVTKGEMPSCVLSNGATLRQLSSAYSVSRSHRDLSETTASRMLDAVCRRFGVDVTLDDDGDVVIVKDGEVVG